MENSNTPEFNDDRMAMLLAPLDDKRQEMKESLKEMRKMFGALKAKIKKYEKIIAALNETTDRSSIMHASHNAQLAMNKFEGIEKKIERCRQTLHNFEKHYKEFPLYARRSDGDYANWTSRTTSYSYSEFKSAMYPCEEMLRIAFKHLKKNDDYFTFLRRLRKGWRV